MAHTSKRAKIKQTAMQKKKSKFNNARDKTRKEGGGS